MGAVVANGGAPGIDGMTTGQLESHIERHWGSLSAKLLAGKLLQSGAACGDPEAFGREAAAGDTDGR